MKHVIITILLFVAIATVGAQTPKGQTFGMSKACYDAVVTLNISKISECFGTSVEVVTPKGGGVYSRKQAEQVLLSYLGGFKSLKCTLSQEKSSAGARLAIGSVKADNKNIRLYILTQQRDDNCVIQQIRFEE